MELLLNSSVTNLELSFFGGNRALEMGLKPRSSFKSWAFVALDPFEDLLLGPAFGAAKVRICWLCKNVSHPSLLFSRVFSTHGGCCADARVACSA